VDSVNLSRQIFSWMQLPINI